VPGKTAILTGAGGGWGRAVLDRFLEQGWNACVTARGAVDVPDGVLAVQADLTEPADAETVVARCLDRFGAVDAVACLAGGFREIGPLHESSPEDWHSQFRVNLDTAYTITRSALRPMVAAGSGSIVYVSSRAAVRPFPGAASYVVSKAAVIALMQAVDVEVRKQGIRANVLLPSIVDTPRNRAENPDADVSRWTTGDELARVIEWLCGDESAPLSGGTIPAYGRA
jgi:NAD(P)-dependent dehydrogenase (short-subunit alcohol dehydrogenase family)